MGWFYPEGKSVRADRLALVYARCASLGSDAVNVLLIRDDCY